MIGWLVPWGLGCGTTTPPTPLAEPGPSLEEVCPTVPPRGYRVERAEASDPDRAVALTAAREKATARLLDRLCGGLSQARCAVVGRSVRPWKDGYHDPSSGFACATVAVASDVLDGVETDQERFERDLAALAAAVVSVGQPVALLEPRWAEGCDAGAVGDKLAALVTNALATHDAVLDDAGPGLALTLTPGRDQLTVTAELRAQTNTTTLPGFTAPLSAMPLPDDAVLGCAPPEPVGRDVGDRDPLVAWLTTVVTDCEGRVGGGHVGLDQWWVRFKLEDTRVRGINVSPGLESRAPQPAQFAVGTCIREALKSETWAPGNEVFKATIQSTLPDGARTTPEPIAGVPLVVRNPSGEWIDVRIDGEVVAELRNEEEATAFVSAGIHQLEVTKFLDTAPFYVGRLDTAGREEVVVGVDLGNRTVTAYDGVGLEPVH